jgi:predicted transcriptional regulator
MKEYRELKQLLVDSGMTQAQFGTLAGISQAKVSKLIRNPQLPQVVETHIRIIHAISELKNAIEATKKA